MKMDFEEILVAIKNRLQVLDNDEIDDDHMFKDVYKELDHLEIKVISPPYVDISSFARFSLGIIEKILTTRKNKIKFYQMREQEKTYFTNSWEEVHKELENYKSRFLRIQSIIEKNKHEILRDDLKKIHLSISSSQLAVLMRLFINSEIVKKENIIDVANAFSAIFVTSGVEEKNHLSGNRLAKLKPTYNDYIVLKPYLEKLYHLFQKVKSQIR